MWGDGTSLPDRNPFSWQFEPRGRKFLYRKNLAGRGVVVTDQEQEALVSAYESAMLWTYFALIPMVCVLGAIGGLIGRMTGVAEGELIGIPVAFVLTPIFFVWRRYRAWNAPAEKLVGRSKVGLDRSRQEARQMRIALSGWDPVIGHAAVAALMIGATFENVGVPRGAGLWVLAPAAAIIAGLAVWAVIKRRALRGYRLGLPLDQGDASRFIR